MGECLKGEGSICVVSIPIQPTTNRKHSSPNCISVEHADFLPFHCPSNSLTIIHIALGVEVTQRGFMHAEGYAQL